MDHLCYLCLVFVMLLSLFIAALWSSEGKKADILALFSNVFCDLLLSYLISLDRCGN